MTRHYVILITLCIIMTSCGGKSSSSQPKLNKPEGFRGISTLRVGEQRVLETECYQIADEESAPYLKDQIVIEPKSSGVANFSLRSMVFSTEYCDSPFIEAESFGSGSFLLDGTLFDATIEAALFTSFDEYVTQSFNEEKVCGIDSWQTAVAKNVFNTECLKDKKGYIYINDHQNGEITLYQCEHGKPLSDDCEALTFKETTDTESDL